MAKRCGAFPKECHSERRRTSNSRLAPGVDRRLEGIRAVGASVGGGGSGHGINGAMPSTGALKRLFAFIWTPVLEVVFGG